MPESNPDTGIVAIVTARGGSKGVRNKNIRPLAGKPLIVHTLEAARAARTVGRVVVTTDDPAIRQVSLDHGAEIVERPPELATDAARSQDAVRHALAAIAAGGPMPEWFILLQPTSPLRRAADIDGCVTAMLAAGAASAISVTEMAHTPYKAFTVDGGYLKPLFKKEYLSTPRQALPPVYRPNGDIFMVRTELFLAEDSFFIDPALPYVMDERYSVDIDTIEDFALAERLLTERR